VSQLKYLYFFFFFYYLRLLKVKFSLSRIAFEENS